MSERKIRLDEKYIRLIENMLSKEDRVEIIPVKNGIRIFRKKSEEVKPKDNN